MYNCCILFHMVGSSAPLLLHPSPPCPPLWAAHPIPSSSQARFKWWFQCVGSNWRFFGETRTISSVFWVVFFFILVVNQNCGQNKRIVWQVVLQWWFCGVTVSTWDSESQDPSSNLGRTCFFFFLLHFFRFILLFCYCCCLLLSRQCRFQKNLLQFCTVCFANCAIARGNN